MPPTGAGRQGLLRKFRESSILPNIRRQKDSTPGGGDFPQLPGEDDELLDLRSGDGEREERGAAEMEKLLSFEASETSLRSDMLISMNVTSAGGGAGIGAGLGVDMSLRQPASVHAPEIKLPSDEELAKQAQRVRLDSMDADTQREFEDEDVESATWAQHQKHVFVLSLSGKPIYSR
ncbi:hypothetical protein GBAR_LOCUS11633 [Geodia barretti]|uniref:Uncharacterized protein n=1 Tax=Geodia barretti TaxID=519541 RepID=A0AA35RY34_GEOBA|nr:hypothetical protein GBAR_LOCUS11633 [Geodia barretti]